MPLEISWSRDGKEFDLSSNAVSTTKIGNKAVLLLIDSVSESQMGNYTCTAKNKAGQDSFSASLNVYGREFYYFSVG